MHTVCKTRRRKRGEEKMARGGRREKKKSVKLNFRSTLTLKPRRGGLEQLVTNLSSMRFSSSVKLSTTSQKIWMTG